MSKFSKSLLGIKPNTTISPLYVNTVLYKNPYTKEILQPSTYAEIVSPAAIEKSYQNAMRGQKRYTKKTIDYALLNELNNAMLHKELSNIQWGPSQDDEYRPGEYIHRMIYEPKERSLHIPPVRDKIVQTLIHDELQKLFIPVFIKTSYACLPGKGPIRAALNVLHDMRVAKKEYGDDAVVIKIDARKFFYSIDREILKKLLVKRFKAICKKTPELHDDLLRFYKLLCVVIDSSPEGETGIPLGNVSSQDFANIYMNEVDQLCVRYLCIKHYTRYMDDIVIIAPNKDIAKEWLFKIQTFMKNRLHLETNQKTQIFPLKQGVNAYGYKIRTTHMMVRTESKRREKRRVKRMAEKVKSGELTEKQFVQAVSSWLGYARWSNSYNLAKKIFASYRDIVPIEGEIAFGAITRNRSAKMLYRNQKRKT